MRLLDLLFAARPLLHLPVWSICLVALHHHHLLSNDRFALADLGILGLLSLAAASAYYINQVYDQQTDRHNRKLGFLQRGFLSERTLMLGFLCTGLAAVGLSLLYSYLLFFIVLQAFALGYFYSAPPLRLKDRPLWGIWANAYGIGWLVPFTVMPQINQHNAGLLGWDNPFYFFFAVAGLTSLTTVPDRPGDLLAGKRTLAVMLGERNVALCALLCFGTAAFIAWRSGFPPLQWIAVLATIMSLAVIIRPASLLVHLAIKLPVLALTGLAIWWYPWYGLFLVVLIVGTRLYYARRFATVYPRLLG